MKSNYRLKLVGTLILFGLAACFAMVNAQGVLAKYIDTGSTVIADAVVLTASNTSLFLDTDGTAPFIVTLKTNTAIMPYNTVIIPGMSVNVIATKSSGNLLARAIRVTGSSYGNVGDISFVREGNVTAKTSTTFTMLSDSGITVTYTVNASTRFFMTTFVSLAAGDRILVLGQKGSSNFIAKTILRR